MAPAALENALVIMPLIEQVCIIGDGKNFISALVVPSFESLKGHIEAQGLNNASPEDIIKHPEIIAAVEKEVESAMEKFPRYEQVRKIALLPGEFTIDGGELTPTLKVKRNVVLERYSSVIENLYAGALTEAPAV